MGDQLAALVRQTARQRGCTIADLIRPAILAAVNQPSTEHLSEIHREHPAVFTPRTLPRDTARQRLRPALPNRLALPALAPQSWPIVGA